MPSVRIYKKNELRFGELTFPQQQMVRLGTVGLASVLNRVTGALGPRDGPAKPLTRNYAIYKSAHGMRNVRDLRGPGGQVFLAAGKRRKQGKYSRLGHMLDGLKLRTVKNNQAVAGFSTEQDRIKARANIAREPFLVFSTRNRSAVMEAARRIFKEVTSGLLKSA